MLLASGDARVEVAAPVTQVVDTIGAGDTAMGALLATCWDRGWLGAPTLGAEQLTAVGAVAVEAAAITCSRPGADPPWLPEMRSGLRAERPVVG
jgi:fructokinase